MDRINQQIQYGSVFIDKPVHNDLVNMMKVHTDVVLHKHGEDSFCILWSQHMKSATVLSSKGRRWNPLVIKWYLYIQHLSSKPSATLELFIFFVLYTMRVKVPR